MKEPDHSTVLLDGKSLTLPDLVRIARDPRVHVKCSPEALERVRECQAEVLKVVDKYKEDRESQKSDPQVKPVLDYGITTGFGEFKDIPIEPDDLEALSRNILLSHSAGAGENA